MAFSHIKKIIAEMALFNYSSIDFRMTESIFFASIVFLIYLKRLLVPGSI